MTGNVSINANGDRTADYALMDMDKDTGEFKVRRGVMKRLRECQMQNIYRLFASSCDFSI